MPTPKSGEKKDQFIQRCMGDQEANNSFPDEKQRYAFCVAQFDKKMKTLILEHDVVDESTRAELEAKGEKCISLEHVRNFLNSANGEDIKLDISTLGGDLATAITIHDLIGSYPGKVTGEVTGLLASAGTVILQACDERIMDSNKLFLVHNGWKSVTGNIYDFQKAVQDMSKTDAIMVNIYKKRTGLDNEKIIDLMKTSEWLTAGEALEYGFIDKITESTLKVAASAIITGAQGKINNQLLIKLKEKMGIFSKKPEEKNYPLALADGNIAVINAEKPAKDVKIAALGEFAFAGGEYELKDGTKINVVDNGDGTFTITEVMDKPEMEVNSEEMINTVATMITNSEAKIEAMIEAKLKPLAAIASKHVPEKPSGPSNPGQSSANDIQTKVEAKVKELKEAAAKKRKGV